MICLQPIFSHGSAAEYLTYVYKMNLPAPGSTHQKNEQSVRVVRWGDNFLCPCCLREYYKTLNKLKWWKGEPSGSITCTRKQQPWFYWSCSSIVMNNATPFAPLAHEGTPLWNVNNVQVHSIIPVYQTNITTQWCSTGFYSRHTDTKHQL